MVGEGKKERRIGGEGGRGGEGTGRRETNKSSSIDLLLQQRISVQEYFTTCKSKDKHCQNNNQPFLLEYCLHTYTVYTQYTQY